MVVFVSSTEIDQLAQLLVKNDRKEIQLFLRNMIEELIKQKSNDLLLWQGWLTALERNEQSSLFAQLVQGIPKDEISKILHEFSIIPILLEEQDPARNKTNDNYLKQWKALLKAYKKLIQETQ